MGLFGDDDPPIKKAPDKKPPQKKTLAKQIEKKAIRVIGATQTTDFDEIKIPKKKQSDDEKGKITPDINYVEDV